MLQNFLDQYNSLLTIQYSDMTLIVNNLHSIPWITVGAYLLIVFQLPKLLVAANLKFSNLSGVMFLWNVLLSLMSLVMTICIGIPYYQRAVATGISYYVCDDHAVRWEASPEVFWTYFFVLTKFVELVDTLFLILKNPERPVPFLHWFHHSTVLIFCWYGAYYRYSAGSTFMLMNSFIHTIMYFYYGLTDLGFKPKWGIVLTVMQILQMVLGIVTNSAWAYMYYSENRTCTCDNPQLILSSCVLMYGAYLFLFCKFFFKRYITGEKKAK